jgi:hypothetical protein
MVDVDNIGLSGGGQQSRCDGVDDMAAQPHHAPEHNLLEARVIDRRSISRAERDQTAIHMPGQRGRQLLRVAFATAEQSVVSELGWRYVGHSHAHLSRHPW